MELTIHLVILFHKFERIVMNIAEEFDIGSVEVVSPTSIWYLSVMIPTRPWKT